MSWVETLLSFIRQFWPFEIVWEYQLGVRYWRGRVVHGSRWWCSGGNLKPGVYMFLPFFGHIEPINVKPDILKLYNMNITTADDKGIRCRANVRYEIFDAILWWNELQDAKDNLADECRTHIPRVMRKREYLPLLGDQDEVEREAKNKINAIAKDWGARVLKIGITDFIRTRDISLASV